MKDNNTLPIPADMDKTQAAVIRDAFIPFLDKADEWLKQAKSINITSLDQTEDMKKARTGRLFLKGIRVDMFKKHKEVKADYLRVTQTIDACHRIGRNLIEEAESHLQKQEDFEKNEKARIATQKQEDRSKELEAFEVDPSGYLLGIMPDETYSQLLANSKLAYETRKAAELKAEQDKIEADRVEAERLENQRLENIRLKEEADKRKEALEKERKEAKAKQDAIEAKARKEREEAAKKLKAEQDKAAKIQKEADDKVQEERNKLAAIQAKKDKEAKDKQDALQAEIDRKQKLEDDRIEREAREQADAAKAKKALELAPDNEKLLLLASRLEAPNMPDVKSKEAQLIINNIQAQLKETAAYIRLQVANI